MGQHRWLYPVKPLYDPIYPNVAQYGKVWLSMAIMTEQGRIFKYGWEWSSMEMCGWAWAMAKNGLNGIIWTSLAEYGTVWPIMTQYESLCLIMAGHGRVWPSMARYGHVRTRKDFICTYLRLLCHMQPNSIMLPQTLSYSSIFSHIRLYEWTYSAILNYTQLYSAISCYILAHVWPYWAILSHIVTYCDIVGYSWTCSVIIAILSHTGVYLDILGNIGPYLAVFGHINS